LVANSKGFGRDLRPVRLAYHPPASSTFLSEQTSHQQPANSTFLRTNQHLPPATSQTNILLMANCPTPTAARRSGSRRRRAVPAGLSKKGAAREGRKKRRTRVCRRKTRGVRGKAAAARERSAREKSARGGGERWRVGEEHAAGGQATTREAMGNSGSAGLYPSLPNGDFAKS
jgi:hypothetical protein